MDNDFCLIKGDVDLDFWDRCGLYEPVLLAGGFLAMGFLELQQEPLSVSLPHAFIFLLGPCQVYELSFPYASLPSFIPPLFPFMLPVYRGPTVLILLAYRDGIALRTLLLDLIDVLLHPH